MEPTKSILIIEDDHDARVALRMVFEDMNFEVFTAPNGLEGIKILFEHKPNLIILDLMMPLMTGEEFLRVKSGTPEWAQIPVIVISASQEHLNSVQIMPKLKKPLDLHSLSHLAQENIAV